MDFAVRGERRDHFGDHLRLDERQIGLHVDDDLAAQVAGRFSDAIRAGAVPRPRRLTTPPNDSTALEMRSSSVATTTASTPRASAARR